MGLSFTVGGAKGTFEGRLAAEVAGVLDQAFGEEGDWEGVTPRHFGELGGAGWALLQARAAEALGEWALTNLLALGSEGRGVYLPAHVRAVSLPLPAGESLRCASLPGLRAELAELADRWGVSLDDASLHGLLHEPPEADDGPVADAPEVFGLARLALAANEAARRDCPLWLVG